MAERRDDTKNDDLLIEPEVLEPESLPVPAAARSHDCGGDKKDSESGVLPGSYATTTIEITPGITVSVSSGACRLIHAREPIAARQMTTW